MDQVKLSEAEKALLRHLHLGSYNREALSDLSNNALYIAGKRLEEIGLIYAMPNSGELLDAMIKPDGEAYLEEYPELDEPISVEIEELTKQNLILQNKALEYEEKIKSQKTIIRVWRLISALLGIAALLFASFK